MCPSRASLHWLHGNRRNCFTPPEYTHVKFCIQRKLMHELGLRSSRIPRREGEVSARSDRSASRLQNQHGTLFVCYKTSMVGFPTQMMRDSCRGGSRTTWQFVRGRGRGTNRMAWPCQHIPIFWVGSWFPCEVSYPVHSLVFSVPNLVGTLNPANLQL